MQNNPQMVLNRLRKYSTTENPKFKRLYANLYSLEFYKLAYSHIYSKPGNMTPASDGSTIDGMSIERIEKLIKKLRDGTYKPTNLRRVNIPKKNGGSRPISIPSVDDKLVQEIIRMILEAVYEDSFSDCSHGFRPGRSCHTALNCVRQQFQSTAWYIEGDIKGCFDNINHERLLQILRERIYDLKFIHLINLFLKAGYIENWMYHNTYSGTPQGSIISPILSNIYLDKFDKFMEKKIEEFTRGKKRKAHKLWKKLRGRIDDTRERIKNGIRVQDNIKRIKEHQRNLRLYRGPSVDMMDPNFRRLRYVRYADDFLISIIGSKKETEEISMEIENFFRKELKLELSPTKHKITHNSKKVRFLGYDVVVVHRSQKKEENGNIRLSVPYDVMINFILENRYGKWWNNPKSKKDELKGIHRPELLNLEEIEILKQYNWKLQGIYNYYSLGENVYKLSNFSYIVHMSFYRTIAGKHKTSCAKLYKNKNYCQNKQIGITYNGKFYKIFSGPFEKKKDYKDLLCNDEKPNIYKLCGRTSLIQRLEARKCEHCGDEEGPFEIHHVKKLKDLKKKKNLQNWEKLMISRHRKTLVLCVTCHHKLHAGKL